MICGLFPSSLDLSNGNENKLIYVPFIDVQYKDHC